ncbi:putative exostosin [Helianthus debilis subsp. tardiflorus]
MVPMLGIFLIVIPIEGLGQCMSAVEYRVILKYRLMIPMYPEDETCPICRKALKLVWINSRKEVYGFKYQHDWVRDVLWDILRRVVISAKKEAHVWKGDLLCDQRICSSLAELGGNMLVWTSRGFPVGWFKGNRFVVGQEARKAESKKVDKYVKACVENQHVFVHFAFDIFGSLAPEVIHFLTGSCTTIVQPQRDWGLSLEG